jgi:hypothetical protein
MNVLSILIKCITIGFVVGFLSSAGPNLSDNILPLAALLLLISALVVTFELTNLEPVRHPAGVALPKAGVQAAPL